MLIMVSVIIWEIQIEPSSLFPKPRAGQYLFLFHVRYYLKIYLIYNKLLK